VPASDGFGGSSAGILISRRRLLLGAAALSAASVMELTGCAGPVATPSPPRWIRVDVSGLAVDQPTWVDLPPPPEPSPALRPAPSQTPPGGQDPPPAGSGGAWLVRRADGTVTAFDPRCTHRSCLYDWEPADRRFACRCHDGFFDIAGEVLGGPAPGPLNQMRQRTAGPGEIELGWQDVFG
jgi:Rieske Fe-S protein